MTKGMKGVAETQFSRSLLDELLAFQGLILFFYIFFRPLINTVCEICGFGNMQCSFIFNFFYGPKDWAPPIRDRLGLLVAGRGKTDMEVGC